MTRKKNWIYCAFFFPNIAKVLVTRGEVDNCLLTGKLLSILDLTDKNDHSLILMMITTVFAPVAPSGGDCCNYFFFFLNLMFLPLSWLVCVPSSTSSDYPFKRQTAPNRYTYFITNRGLVTYKIQIFNLNISKYF